jgi:hypothetical protein
VPDTVCLQDEFHEQHGSERVYVSGRLNLFDGDLAGCIKVESIHLLSRTRPAPNGVTSLLSADPSNSLLRIEKVTHAN